MLTIDGRRWWPDLGLGDALRDPVEVAAGPVRPGPFSYEITDVAAGAWRFWHDPAAHSFEGLSATSASATEPSPRTGLLRRLADRPGIPRVSLAGAAEDELRSLHARMLAVHQERAAAGGR
ncbi:MAG TPA: hypothetical protein VHV09_15885 [Trebonia sp.]|nr:hypothetical protein [Trebonia sp.]